MGGIMAFKDEYEFELLVNEAEEIVIDELEKELNKEENADICKCQECVLDMATLALNNLKPHYRSSYLGKLYAQQYRAGDYIDEVRKSVKIAVDKVCKNPSHD